MSEPQRYTLLFYADDEDDQEIWEWIKALRQNKRQNEVKAALLRGIQQKDDADSQQSQADNDTFSL
jgi:hypothetical protein